MQDDRTLNKLTLGRLEDTVGFLLRRAYRHSVRHVLPVLNSYDFKELEATALIIIIENPGCSLTDVARAVDVELPVAQRHLKALEKARRITSSKSRTDRRVTTYLATEKGVSDYQEMAEQAHRVDDALYEVLSPKDYDAMMRSLRMLSGID